MSRDDDDNDNDSESGSSHDSRHALSNIEIFVERGMLSDAGILTAEGVALLSSLKRREVRQLIKIWERLGKPALPQTFFDAFAD